MNSDHHVAALAALAHPDRLAVFRLLARRAPDGVRPTEIAAALGLKPNTLSGHVHALTDAGLARTWRDGKSVFYSIDLGAVGGLVEYLVADCCRGRPDVCAPAAARLVSHPNPGGADMANRTYNALFICTGNSARSIFAEAILAKEGGGRFNAFSAGTRPSAGLNPFAVEILERMGHDVSGLRAKHIAAFQGEDAPRLDFVFTVCDQAANEECPPWPGQTLTAHWGLPDPVKAEGAEAERALAFRQAYGALERRIRAFVALPLASLDRISLQTRLDAIGREADAPADEAAG